MTELKQRHNFTKREFRITESKLFYNHSEFGNENEIDIPFENIDGEKVSFHRSNNAILIFSLIPFFISIILLIDYLKENDVEQFAWLFWLIISFVIFFIYWRKREKFWKIKLATNSYLYIHKNVPKEKTVNDFIDKLMTCRNQFLRENYATIDENLDYQSQLNNFRWLKSIGAVSKNEFDILYGDLKKTVKPDKANIGFKK